LNYVSIYILINFAKYLNYLDMFDNFPIDKFKRIPYNTNKAYQIAELNYLQSLPKDIDWVLRGDEITNYYLEFLNKNNLKPTDEVIADILNLTKQMRKPIMELKEFYGRIRPYEFAKEIGLDLSYVKLKSTMTPAYPSGHSTQATFLSLMLANIYPELKNELLIVSNDICFSRLVGRVHYPSDDVLGRNLGISLFEHIKKDL